jgi:hypothetical protein
VCIIDAALDPVGLRRFFEVASLLAPWVAWRVWLGGVSANPKTR